MFITPLKNFLVPPEVKSLPKIAEYSMQISRGFAMDFWKNPKERRLCQNKMIEVSYDHNSKCAVLLASQGMFYILKT